MVNNKVDLIGTLTRKPELTYTPNGKAIVRALLAVDRGFGRDSGTDWIRVVLWGKAAESVAQYQDKGSKLAMTGRLTGKFYDTKEGQTRLDLEVSVSEMPLFLSSRRAASAEAAPAGKSSGKAA